ncbi:MAG: hypothetical protein A2020_15500 [Lentisphaerae bacterium GWF2_45_14]|nr:MAG: hypothetical protein A2020_15500 [Lentisphaerae bacterium GWF2_45_14]
MIETVKKTFRKITFSSSDVNKKSYLVMINIPAQMARRDTAYDIAVKLIREHLFAYTEEKRSEIYGGILKLLGEVVSITELVTFKKTGEKKGSGTEGMYDYFVILNDTVKAAASLARQELAIYKDEGRLSEILGADVSSQIRTTDEVFSNSEMNIYHCIIELVDLAEPTVKKYREYWKKSFSKTNQSRYTKSFSEFETIYNSFISAVSGEKPKVEDIELPGVSAINAS